MKLTHPRIQQSPHKRKTKKSTQWHIKIRLQFFAPRQNEQILSPSKLEIPSRNVRVRRLPQGTGGYHWFMLKPMAGKKKKKKLR